MGSKGSGEGTPRSSGGLEDTVPASEPPLDVDGTPMRSSRASIPPIQHQRYRLGVELGRGGMGRVVEAFDTRARTHGRAQGGLAEGTERRAAVHPRGPDHRTARARVDRPAL